MTPPEPPRAALALLRRYLPDNEALAGDLVEAFAAGRSRTWFWRQVLLAVAIHAWQPSDRTHPLGLADPAEASELPPPVVLPSGPINLTASPLPGIGGLGIASLVLLVFVVRPEAWWMFAPAAAGGVLLGLTLVLARRHRPLNPPDTGPHVARSV